MKSSKFPIQSAPVVRTITGAPMSSGNGVEASLLSLAFSKGPMVGWFQNHPLNPPYADYEIARAFFS